MLLIKNSEKNENYNLHLNFVSSLFIPGRSVVCKVSRLKVNTFAMLHFSFVPDFLPKLYAIVICLKDLFEFVAVVIKRELERKWNFEP